MPLVGGWQELEMAFSFQDQALYTLFSFVLAAAFSAYGS
jgi:hypothetical protein